MVRVFLFQPLKHEVHRALKVRVILASFTGVYHFQQGGEVHFFCRGLVPDVANECGVEQPFRLHPKIFRRFFTLALCVGNQGVYQLQHILFRVDVNKRVVLHGLGKVYRVQDFHPVACPLEHLARFQNQCAFWVCDHE